MVGGSPSPLLLLALVAPVCQGAREVKRRHASVSFTISADGAVPKLPFLDVPGDFAGILGKNDTVECFKTAYGHPSEIPCPEACPFMRAEPTQMCAFSCVPATHCRDDDPLASFANPKTKRCEGCKAMACLQCKTSWTCARCQEGFIIGRFGTCVSAYRQAWTGAYIVMGIIGVPVLYYLLWMPFRPVVNEHSLEKGLEFREECKQFDQRSGTPFKLWRDLGKSYIAGIGVMLHFRWQQMVICWAVAVSVIYIVLSAFFNTRPSAIKHDPSSPKAFASCEHGVVQQAEEFVLMEKTYFFAALLIYIGSTVGSLALAVTQRRLAQRTLDEVISMEDYAVLATGMPIWKGTKKAEEDVKKFFQERFPDMEVVGASVCWNYRDKSTKTWIEEQVHEEVYKLDCEFDEFTTGDDSRKSLKKQVSQLMEREKPRKCWQHPRLECLDAIFGVGPGLLEEEERDKTPEEIRQELEELESTGDAFIVFHTERQCQEVMKRSILSPLHWDASHPLTLEQFHAEPDTVNWNGFGVSMASFIRNIMIGNLVIFAAVILLDIFFYAPYVVYIFMYMDVKGAVGGQMVQGTLLGLLITVCNVIIYQLIAATSEKCGFRFLGYQRQFYVVQYTVAVFFNTCVDLWTVMLLAQGFSVDQVASKMKDPAGAMGEGGILSPKAIAEQPSVQRSVYTQLYQYLFPGCLLAPFILEPLVVAITTYCLPVWLVRSRKEVDVNNAEQMLAAPEFDLSRYGDILVNLMLCVLMISFTYRDLYLTFVYLLISLCWIYGWDHYRFLRSSRRSLFPSPLLEFTAHFLLAFPCAILAAVLVFHVWAASDDGFLEPLANVWKHTLRDIVVDDLLRNVLRLARNTIIWYMAGAFALHLLIHFWILTWFVPRWSAVHADHDDTVPYSETAATCPCTWFNSNPVFTLRSKYIYKHNPPCIPYEVGKAYLLKPNPTIGQYFVTDETPEVHRKRSLKLGLKDGA